MIINVHNSMMVRPSEEMSRRSLWVSNLDLVLPRIHTPYLYFYRSNGSSNFFSPNPIKEALSRALVLFYPIAGRLGKDRDGRVEIDCIGDGVSFLEAETPSLLDDLHDFTSISEFKDLVPIVDYSGGIFSYPLCVIQLTRFKCGGISVGVRLHHLVADGSSSTHFINTWAEISRGLDASIPPVHDRALVRGRDPPQPKFEHIEYQPPPRLLTKDDDPQDITCQLFKISSDQINALKAASKQGDVTYTTNDIVSGHIWRCACLARGIGGRKDQATRLYIAVDARPRLQQPTLPQGYFGNAVLFTIADETGEVMGKPSWYAASRVHEAVARMDNEYLRSKVDHLELQHDLDALIHGVYSYRSPNLGITSWRWFPVYDSDFGWGRPVSMRVARVYIDGQACILPCPVNDGSISFAICLKVQHMKLFEKYIYDI